VWQGSKAAQQPQAAVDAAAPKKAAKKPAPKKAAAAEKKDSSEKEGSTENEGSARKETSAVVAQTGQGADKGKNAHKPREKKPAEKKASLVSLRSQLVEAVSRPPRFAAACKALRGTVPHCCAWVFCSSYFLPTLLLISFQRAGQERSKEKARGEKGQGKCAHSRSSRR
jgi:hypothetical protein